MFKVGLLGLGTVGSGVYEIITGQKGDFSRSDDLEIKKVLVRNKNKKRAINIDEGLITDNFNDIVNDSEIDIVVSVMGGMEPEFSYIKEALKNKKNVVTANKEIISVHLKELLMLAKENGVKILFEASVGGGIPIIESVVETLKVNKIDRIQGILNGTTNFIVSKMTNESLDFNEVLKLAQELGFAEADPTADVEGHDISRKLTILSTLCFGTHVEEETIYKRGISNISFDDIKMATGMGHVFKYLAEAQTFDGKYSGSVAPILVKENSIIANVNAEYNIITINGSIIGQLSFLGKGAGKEATANAAVSDVLKILNGSLDYSHLTFDNDFKCAGIANYKGNFYLRVSVNNSEEFNRAIDLISNNVSSLNLIVQNNKIFFKTEEKYGQDMHELYIKLKEVCEDVFYARILEDTL